MSQSGLQRILGLYRTVLRVHRHKVPKPLRPLGDSYAQEEFRRHLKAKTTQPQWREFVQQWTQYCQMLNGEADLAERSGELPDDVVERLTPEQLQQLEELKQAALEYGQEFARLRNEPGGGGGGTPQQ
jgi:hypothetical protein